MVHLAGLNDKTKWMKNVLRETDSWGNQIALSERVQTENRILRSRKELSLAPSELTI